MASMKSRIPTLLWAQTKQSVYVTIDIPDVTNEKISVATNILKFSGKSRGTLYECEMKLFEEINPECSKYEVRGRGVFLIFARKEAKEDKEEVYWPRLLKDKNLQKRFVKYNWDKWVDEDEDKGDNEVDTSQMQDIAVSVNRSKNENNTFVVTNEDVYNNKDLVLLVMGYIIENAQSISSIQSSCCEYRDWKQTELHKIRFTV